MKQIKKTITKAEIAAMPKVLFPGRIFVIYTESEAEKAVAYLKDQRITQADSRGQRKQRSRIEQRRCQNRKQQQHRAPQ